jgi:putative ABC transport system permease protein
MFKNYLIIAFRYFWRNRVYTLINVFSLSIALTVCILLILYTQNELSFDKFHPNLPRIFQIYHVRSNPNYSNQTSHKLAPEFARNNSQIEAIVRTFELGRVLKIDKQRHNASIQAVDKRFFEVFDFKFLKGNPQNALTTENSVVLSEKIAKEYFGTVNILGKKILYESENSQVWDTLVVRGIVENCPLNSSIYYEVLISYEKFIQEIEREQVAANFAYHWLYNTAATFVLLAPNAPVRSLERNMAEFYKQKVQADSILYFQSQKEHYEPAHRDIKLLPLAQIHLNYHNLSNETVMIKRKSSWRIIFIFGTISLLILLVACFNFTNLSLVQYINRAKEIGLRKVIGATRRHLISQFYSEAFLLNTMAMALAIIMAYFSLPIFNSLTEKQLTFDLISDYQAFLWILLLIVLSTILAGFYPAWVFSDFQPNDVLKGHHKIKYKSRFSTFLVILQFATAVAFIIIMLVMNFQLDFISNKLKYSGRDVNNLIELYPKSSNQPLNINHIKIKNKIEYIKGVQNVSIIFSNSQKRLIQGMVKNKSLENTVFTCADKDFVTTMQMKITSGRDFKNLQSVDNQHYPVLVNQTFIQTYQLKNPLGVKIQLNNLPEYAFEIIGVIEDYLSALNEKVRPEILIYNTPENPIPKYPFNQMFNWTIRIDTMYAKPALKEIEEIVNKYEKNDIGVYQINMQAYIQEGIQPYLILPKILSNSSIIPILIALMGLLGIASFNVTQRTKEIGIRKTLGASENEIMFLLAYEFQQLVLLGILIALPVAAVSIYYWLSSFAYSISLTLILLLMFLSSLGVFTLSLITVLLLVFRKAYANPVESLRYE